MNNHMQKLIWTFIMVFSISFMACKQTNETNNETDSTTTVDSAEIDTSVDTDDTQPMETTIADATTTDNQSDEKEVKPKEKTSEKTTSDKKQTATNNTSSKPKTVTSQTTTTTTTTTTEPKVSSKKSPEPVEPIEDTSPKTTTTTSTPKEPEPSDKKNEPTVDEDKEKVKPAPEFSHSDWDGLLRKHVNSSGKVDYAGLKADKGILDGYIKNLQVNPPQSDWSKNKTMAYWINAYNAYTVKLIVDNYPVKSIRDLNGGNPWDVKNITIGGQKYSLNEIEKDILLKKYKEPRVHFAVNCAAKSCPALLNQAWTESNIQAKFEQQTLKFINNRQYNKLDKREVELSKIFDWYASDFGDVLGFIRKYSDTEIKDNANISYIPYDWSLNN